MRISHRRFIFVAAAALIGGQSLSRPVSAGAADAPPVAVDLVDLAVALPDAAGSVRLLEWRLEFAEQQNKKGYVTAGDYQTLRIETEAARQKLELLKLIAQAELDVATLRSVHLKQLHESGGVSTAQDVRAAELRRALLQQMLKLADVQFRAADAATPSQSDARPGTFWGVVRVHGDLPALPPLVRTGDALVSNLGTGEVLVRAAADIPDADSLLVGAEHGLANVFVFRKPAPPVFEADVSGEAIAITSRNNRFEPHCAIARVGQDVRLTSQASVATNFHLFPVRNETRNQVIAPNDAAGIELQFARNEPLPFKVADDIHPWKSAYLLVVDHPFAALTDENGRFEIEGLPPGEHVFRFWHERGGFIERDYVVTIGDDEGVEAAITVEAERLFSAMP
ncbi:MAG: hypothetical protein AB7U20_22770 [Planctomycetaceae bacterium]